MTARALVLDARRVHDGALAFEGNDLPGVMSARAGAWLAKRGVAPGARVVAMAHPDADGKATAAFVHAAAKGVVVEVIRGEPRRAAGSSPA